MTPKKNVGEDGASVEAPIKTTPMQPPVSTLDPITTRKVRTRLIKKEELFRSMALAEVTQLPLLLIGPPGVAKTAALIDYAAAMMEYDKTKAKEKAFIIELDESTKASEIKGRVDMKEFLENKNYHVDAPIVDCEYILINEVDKGSSAIRNAMLSIMREKRLFLGRDIRKCHWKIFAASCNVIPSDELESPFWDRFVIKHSVDRITSSDIMETWAEQKFEVEVPIPTKDHLESVQLNMGRMKIFADTIHKSVSDRTLTYLPSLVRAVKLIWRISEVQAIIKVCQYISPGAVNGLSSVIEDPRIVQLKNELQLIAKVQEIDKLVTRLDQIITTIASYGNTVSLEDIEDLASNIRYVTYKKKFASVRQRIDDKLNALISGEMAQGMAADKSGNASTDKVEVEIEEEATKF